MWWWSLVRQVLATQGPGHHGVLAAVRFHKLIEQRQMQWSGIFFPNAMHEKAPIMTALAE